VLILIDALADAILLTIDPVLFRFGQMSVVRCHVSLLAVLHAGFAVFQIAGLLRAQRTILDAVGNAILLVGFATVYLIDPRMAGINDARSGARGGCGLGNGGGGEYQASDCQDQE